MDDLKAIINHFFGIKCLVLVKYIHLLYEYFKCLKLFFAEEEIVIINLMNMCVYSVFHNFSVVVSYVSKYNLFKIPSFCYS